MKNWASIFLTIYVLETTGTQVTKHSFEGQSIEVVTAMFQDRQKNNPGMVYSVVDKASFDAAPIFIPTTTPIDPLMQQAISDAKNGTLDPQTRLDALIKAINLK